MNKDKPPYLYHGSRHLVTELDPHPAHGVGPEKDRLNAVYASHVAEFATAFALPIVANEDGAYAWKMDFDPEKPEIVILTGHLDLSRKGYLYRVHSEPFEATDEFQWVSYVPVTPIDYQVIDPAEYAHWVRSVGQDEIAT